VLDGDLTDVELRETIGIQDTQVVGRLTAAVESAKAAQAKKKAFPSLGQGQGKPVRKPAAPPPAPKPPAPKPPAPKPTAFKPVAPKPVGKRPPPKQAGKKETEAEPRAKLHSRDAAAAVASVSGGVAPPLSRHVIHVPPPPQPQVIATMTSLAPPHSLHTVH
jgi:hypothetical protein